MDLAIELTTDYVKQRKAFGKSIMEFQNTRFKLAECKTEAHIARVFVDNCLQRHLAGELDVTTAAMVKWWCAQKQNEVIDECLQLFGGYGFMDEFPISRMYADARVQKIYGGTNEIMKELIARDAVALRDGRHPSKRHFSHRCPSYRPEQSAGLRSGDIFPAQSMGQSTARERFLHSLRSVEMTGWGVAVSKPSMKIPRRVHPLVQAVAARGRASKSRGSRTSLAISSARESAGSKAASSRPRPSRRADRSSSRRATMWMTMPSFWTSPTTRTSRAPITIGR